MKAEEFIYWLEGYIKGSKMDIAHRSDILNKIDEVKKNQRDREPIEPPVWPNAGTTYPYQDNYNSTLT